MAAKKKATKKKATKKKATKKKATKKKATKKKATKKKAARKPAKRKKAAKKMAAPAPARPSARRPPRRWRLRLRPPRRRLPCNRQHFAFLRPRHRSPDAGAVSFPAVRPCPPLLAAPRILRPSGTARSGRSPVSPIRRSLPLLAFALLAAVPVFAAKPIALEIHVQSAAGGDIEGATVTVSATAGDAFTASGATDAAGRYQVEVPDGRAEYRIEVSHDGFKKSDGAVDLKGQKAPRGKPLGLTVELQPFDAADHFNAGVAFLRGKEMSAAEAEFHKAVELDPTLAAGWRVLGMIAADGRRYEEALDAAEHAIALDAADTQSMRTRYEALAGLDRKDDAMAALDDLYAQDRTEDTARLLFNAGAEAANAGAGDTARLRLSQALELEPGLWQAHTALAELAVREQKLDEAVAEIDKALAISPRNFKAWERKIEILRAMGNEDGAKAEAARLEEARGKR